MSPETLNHIAEPFYTTKGTGGGLGLGTFLVALICRAAERKSDFRIRSWASAPRPFWNYPSLAMTEKDKPAVLIMDDDEVFRTRLRRAFELRGWEAHVAASGKEALIRARETGPDLAIVDLRMPGESGLDIVKSLREWDCHDLNYRADRIWQHRDRT